MTEDTYMLESVNFAEDITVTVGVTEADNFSMNDIGSVIRIDANGSIVNVTDPEVVNEANGFFVNCTGPKGITAFNDFSVGDIGLSWCKFCLRN